MLASTQISIFHTNRDILESLYLLSYYANSLPMLYGGSAIMQDSELSAMVFAILTASPSTARFFAKSRTRLCFNRK